jgi:hypothetical protein
MKPRVRFKRPYHNYFAMTGQLILAPTPFAEPFYTAIFIPGSKYRHSRTAAINLGLKRMQGKSPRRIKLNA